MEVEKTVLGKQLRTQGKVRRYVIIGLITILLLVVEIFGFRYYLTINVTVNQSKVTIPRGTTLGQLLKLKKIHLKSGDLFDVDGKLLRKAEGHPPVLKVNGQPANSSYKLKDGDRVVAKSGADLHEKIVEKLEPILPSYKIVGNGAFVCVVRRGKPGIKVVRVGLKSRIVFSEVVKETPAQSVIKKYDKTGKKVVALTFDDGPHPKYTPQVLSILQGRGVKATFFVLGKQAEKYPSLLKRIVQAGCVIGNHTYSHAYLGKLSYHQMISELSRVDKIIKRATGKRSYWIRSPGGYLSPLLIDTAVGNGYQVVAWSVDPRDWRNQNPTAISQFVISNVRAGAVILLHDGGGNRAGTVAALPSIIDGLRTQGYEFVSLDELYKS